MRFTHRVYVAKPTAGMEAGMADPEWVSSLRQVCGLLWPAPAVVTLELDRPRWAGLAGPGWAANGAVDGATSHEFTLVPGMRRPPLLVPSSRRVAAIAMRHHIHPASAALRFGVRAVALGLARGLGGFIRCGRVQVSVPPGADTIEEHLRVVLGRGIQVSMSLGTARANRKPVLQLLDGDCRTAAFVKIGINPLTSRLVRAEHQTLTQLARAGLAGVSIPEVLHFDTWHDLDVLVLSALPAWLPRRQLPAAKLAVAMAELAAVDGLRRGPAAASEYLRQLRARLASAAPSAEQAALLAALAALSGDTGLQQLTFGSWHGDWSPWNMAHTSAGLLLWDWERFTTGVPLGFDALHHQLQVSLAAGRQPPPAAVHCLAHAPAQLAPFQIPPDQARLTAILYLIDLAIRYLADEQAAAGATLGAPGTWLIPAITGQIIQP